MTTNRDRLIILLKGTAALILLAIIIWADVSAQIAFTENTRLDLYEKGVKR